MPPPLGHALKTLIKAHCQTLVSEAYYQELIVDFFNGFLFWSELPVNVQYILRKWHKAFPDLKINIISKKAKKPIEVGFDAGVGRESD